MINLSKRVEIVILDDHHIFLDAIELLIKSIDPSYNVSSFSSAQDVLTAIEGGKVYDLILCDLIMSAMNGLAFLGALRSYTKDIPVIILSGINTRPPIQDVRRLGGAGFVHKSAHKEEFKEAIETVLAGGSHFENSEGVDSGDHASKQEGSEPLTGTAGKFPELAPRQVEVLKLIANGHANKDIASELHISENTVKTHLKQIFRELGVNKRTACVRKAQSLGLI